MSSVLGSSLPTFDPAVGGTWRRPDAHTLVFTPSGAGMPLATRVHVILPRTLAIAGLVGGAVVSSDRIGWVTPTPSTLRLQQLLAQLGYLPLDWRASGPAVPRTVRRRGPPRPRRPAGSFSWRYPNTPPELRALWSPGQPNTITRGAVMTFEHDNGLAVDGIAGPMVWHALHRRRRRRQAARTRLQLRLRPPQLPQSLNALGRRPDDPRPRPATPASRRRPTALGTFPVFEHIPVGTMSGTNPDGSHYHDPGIRWISYFNGGDAIHAFTAASYGTPQSLGCVELPLAAAAKVWPLHADRHARHDRELTAHLGGGAAFMMLKAAPCGVLRQHDARAGALRRPRGGEDAVSPCGMRHSTDADR